MGIRTQLTSQELNQFGPLRINEQELIDEWYRFLTDGLHPDEIGELSPDEIGVFLDRTNELDQEHPLGPQTLPSDVRDRIHVLDWKDTSDSLELARLMATLRNRETNIDGFRKATEDAYRCLFREGYQPKPDTREFRTSVNIPFDQWVRTQVPVYQELSNLSLAMILRAALLPTFVMAQEAIDRNGGQSVPILPLKIARSHVGDRTKQPHIYTLNENYIPGLKLEGLIEVQQGRNIGIADPMLATAGSAVLLYLMMTNDGKNDVFASWKSFFVIGTYEGAIKLARACPRMHIYMISMDRLMNPMGYIIPGLGDAGDRLNGPDISGRDRDITALIKGYGSGMIDRYADAIHALYATSYKKCQKIFKDTKL